MAYGSQQIVRQVVGIAVTALFLLSPQILYAAKKYVPPPKTHFLSWESLRRPYEYRRYKKQVQSKRKFEFKRFRVIKFKNNGFINFNPIEMATPVFSSDNAIAYVGASMGRFYALDMKQSKKKWATALNGSVHSSAVLGSTYIYVGDAKGYVYSLNQNNGQRQWHTQLDTSVLSTPLLYKDNLYVMSSSGRLYALNKDTGIRQWHTDAMEKAIGLSIHGNASPIRYLDSIIIGTPIGTLIAYDYKNGQVKWVRQLSSRQNEFHDIHSTPTLFNDMLYVTTAEGKLFNINPKNGHIAWDMFVGGSNQPIIHDDRIYVSGENRLTALNRLTGKIVWQQEFDNHGLSVPVIGNDYLAISSSMDRLYIIDPSTGAIAGYRYIRKGSLGNPVIVNEKLYVLSNSGHFFAFGIHEVK